MTTVVWHDVECGGYAADLPLWRELARTESGPVLDVGAGTGRVALDLASEGHEVVALDVDAELLAALSERAVARGLSVHTVRADAADFEIGVAVGLVLVPMQTIQLLPGAAARLGFLASVRRHLVPGGLVAISLAEDLEPFEGDTGGLPPPDVGERDGWRYLSHPVAVRALDDGVRMERIRQVIAPDGTRLAEGDAVQLARIDPAELEAEGRSAGLRPEPRRSVEATAAHVGATVVILRG